MTYKAQTWMVPKKLQAMMNKYLMLQEHFNNTRSTKTDHELFMLKTDILNLLFKD